MNFKQTYIAFMVVSLFLTAALVMMYMRRGWCAVRREGFESGPDAAHTIIEEGKSSMASLTNSLYTTIKFVNKYRKSFGADFKNERKSLLFMSPVELARMHLQSQQPK